MFTLFLVTVTLILVPANPLTFKKLFIDQGWSQQVSVNEIINWKLFPIFINSDLDLGPHTLKTMPTFVFIQAFYTLNLVTVQVQANCRNVFFYYSYSDLDLGLRKGQSKRKLNGNETLKPYTACMPTISPDNDKPQSNNQVAWLKRKSRRCNKKETKK